ncbi:histidine phosphatase family protein [Lactobacillus delbrueckii]|uniref:histidine phosphatase family protein n=1 Tax=Lactobacillus delbrueckii TaxID=1584 RepID=UPI001E47F30E|nr:histidine phosphatase family protein [Lactobacillus delbrueckii]MCD5505537.1 histidine phosphatase family protein [Lactobacillus delbrueckii subsp. lactis]
MKKIYVVRHGRTYLNKYQRLQGWSDAPLTEEGIEGAHRMGKALKDQHFDLVASSDLKRAADTRKIIVSENDNWESTEMTQTADLRELFFGYYEAFHDMEGVAAAFKSTKYPRLVDAVKDGYTWQEIGDLFHAADPEGDAESGSEFESRLKRGIDYLVNHDESERILLVGHACVIHCLACIYGGKHLRTDLPKHNEMTVLNVDDNGQVSLEEFGRPMY